MARTHPAHLLAARYLVGVDASGHGPGGHDVVHHPLAQAFGDLVEFEKVSHAVEHLVVAVSVGVHLLEDGGDVTKDGSVQQRCKQEAHNTSFTERKSWAEECPALRSQTDELLPQLIDPKCRSGLLTQLCRR